MKQLKSKLKRAKRIIQTIPTFIKSWINSFIYKPYTDLEIPVKKFYNAIEKNDLRYLLKTDKLPTYNIMLLTDPFDNIFKQYSIAIGSNAYDEYIERQKDELNGNIDDTLLVIAFDLLLLHRNECFEFFKALNIDITSFSESNRQKADNIIKSKINKKNIDKIRKKNIENANDKGVFADFVADVEIGLGYSLDINKMSLDEWCSKVRGLKRKIENQKKTELANGRG